LPTVERGSIKLDLHRRDFTINTLALRIDGHHYGDLYDFWGGLNDLNLGLVRVLHSLSFVDDPTRMLRAVRFEQRFGFEIESRTLQLLTEALSLMARVSGDRIHHELDHILDEPRGDRMISRLEKLELLKAIHPDLVYDPWLQDRFDMIPHSRPVGQWFLLNAHDWDHLTWLEFRRMLIYGLWLVRLEPGKVKSIGERIKHPAKPLNELVAASKLLLSSSEMLSLKPSQVTVLLDEYPVNSIAIVYLGTEDEQVKEILRDYSESYRFIHSELNGNDLRACGLSPGPVYRRILSQLRAAWLDGDITSTEQEKDLFDQLVKQALSQS
jgi:tRNA nucleotidyltransferase (CCA-adding enzyme)